MVGMNPGPWSSTSALASECSGCWSRKCSRWSQTTPVWTPAKKRSHRLAASTVVCTGMPLSSLMIGGTWA
eukprot:3321505-Alexandrium_andersonii.AAC.1